MEQQRSVTHNTFVVERKYPAAPERVFAAFADPVRKRRWYGGGEKTELVEFEMDFREGGSDHVRQVFKSGSPFPGVFLINHTTYLDIVPGKRIVFAYTMTLGEKRFSASLATVEFVPDGTGTNMVFTDQGAYFEGADGVQIREKGWRGLLERLAESLASESIHA